MNSIFEQWRQNTLEEAREDDLKSKYGPRFLKIKRYIGSFELMNDMIKWVNETDYDEFQRRYTKIKKRSELFPGDEGYLDYDEMKAAVSRLRGEGRPTFRKDRLKYLDWMLGQVELFANRVELPNAEGKHSTLRDLQALADKEAAELTGNAIRRYVADYVKNPGPNIKAYESALKTVSNFRNGLKSMVDDFDKNKRAMKEKDINRYENMGTLRAALDADVYEPRIDKSIAGYETRVREQDARFFDLPRPFTMVRPLSTKASCAYGSGKWCIAQKGNEHFDDYTQNNDIVFYIVQDHSQKKESKYSIITFQVVKDTDFDGNYIDWKVEGYWDYPNRFHDNFGRLRFEYGDEIVDSMLKFIDDDMENFSGEKKDDEEKSADMEPGAPRQIDRDDDYDAPGPRFQNAGEQYADDRAMRGGDWYSDDEEPVRESKKLKLSIKVKFVEKKKKKAGTESSKESSLHHWFKRKGAKGKKSGWVDCNAPDGKGGYKACGRESGEKRKKYPACRPTPGACKERGRGKSWGKKASKRKKK